MRYIKITTLFFILIFGGFVSIAQTQIIEPEEKEFQLFKENNNVRFILPDLFTIEEYKTVLNEVWTFSPFTLELGTTKTFDESSVKEGDAIAIFNTFNYTFRKERKYLSNNLITSQTDFYDRIEFKYCEKIKKGKPNLVKIGHIDFTTPFSGDEVIEEEYLDYKLGYLKNMFQQMNNYLENDIYPENKSPELKALKNETLYIDESLFKDLEASAYFKYRKATEKLFSDYEFSYEIVAPEVLQDMILTTEDDFYYFLQQQVNSSKKVYIVNGKSGQTVFRYSSMMGSLNSKDIKKLNKAISKAK